MLAFSHRMTARMTAHLSAVVPTLDEERTLGPTLARLARIADQIVVADGGSRDATREIATRAGALWLACEDEERGRGAQLAAGARRANGDVLLFVHADTLVPESARELILGALAQGALGGAFRIRFDASGWRYRLGERVASWRSSLTRTSFGDQAQFARRDTYELLGGFRPWPLFEDYDFSRRLKRAGRVAILPAAVVTSARRFERLGPARTVLRNWHLLLRFHFGASPEELARSYRSN